MEGNVFRDLLAEFDLLCSKQFEKGRQEYGEDAFLQVDLFQYIYEELADLSNYATLMYVKLRRMQEAMRERGLDLSDVPAGQDPQHGLPLGATAFTPAGEVPGVLQVDEGLQDPGQRRGGGGSASG